MTGGRLKRLILVTLMACLVLVIGVAWYGYSLLDKPMLTQGEPVIIEVKANSSANTLASQLFDKNLIDSKPLFLFLIKWTHSASRLKAGVYEVTPGESALDLIYKIVNGNVLQLPFRITEGTTLVQVKNNLQTAPYLNYQPSDWSFLPLTHPNNEGLLLADTYAYNAGSDARNLLKQAHQNLMQELEKNWQDRSPGLPYKNAYELLVVASILEKEAAVAQEREIISGVVVNRLRKNMPLQMDPTVIYALGDAYTGKLHHRDLTIDSPYNTYRYRGLPPTPITMVGKQAIYAAAHPQQSNYLYFVAKGDGTHVFSETYNEQKQAITRYLSGKP